MLSLNKARLRCLPSSSNLAARESTPSHRIGIFFIRAHSCAEKLLRHRILKSQRSLQTLNVKICISCTCRRFFLFARYLFSWFGFKASEFLC
jgi:hypothetical protein